MYPTFVQPRLLARSAAQSVGAATARWLGLLIVAAAAAGCATMNVNSFMERRADFRQFRTYAWQPADSTSTSTGDPRLDNNRFFDERVRAQIDKALEGRGFERVTAAEPDLLVHYHVSFSQEIDVRTIDRQSNFCAVADCRPFIYEAGTLFIDLVEARTDTLVWRGWAEGSMEGAIDNQQWMDARIDETVSKILRRLPRRL